MIGGLLVRLQVLIFVTGTLAVMALTFWAYWPPTLGNILGVGVISLALLLPFATANVFVTMKWGRYAVRE